MQVEVDVKCMYTNFGGHGLSSFGDIFNHLIEPILNFPFQTMGIHGDQKIQSNKAIYGIHTAHQPAHQ